MRAGDAHGWGGDGTHDLYVLPQAAYGSDERERRRSLVAQKSDKYNISLEIIYAEALICYKNHELPLKHNFAFGPECRPMDL